MSTSIPFTCEECGRTFEPFSGAACTRCQRLLCARHFSVLGSLGIRLGSGDLVCSRCKRENRAASD